MEGDPTTSGTELFLFSTGHSGSLGPVRGRGDRQGAVTGRLL